jgi:transcriptional regulator with XRE-family HTH domain
MTEEENMRWNLRYYRRKAGLAQDTLALEAGVWLSTISRIENDWTSSTSIRTLVRICQVLGISVATILEDPTPEMRAKMREYNRTSGQRCALNR